AATFLGRVRRPVAVIGHRHPVLPWPLWRPLSQAPPAQSGHPKAADPVRLRTRYRDWSGAACRMPRPERAPRLARPRTAGPDRARTQAWPRIPWLPPLQPLGARASRRRARTPWLPQAYRWNRAAAPPDQAVGSLDPARIA